MNEDIPAAVSGDPERELARTVEDLANRAVPPRRSDQEQESPAAGAQQLASDSADLARPHTNR